MEAKRRIAILSNVNMNFIIRMLKKDFEVYDVAGYGNELGILYDRQSSYYEFDAQITFFFMDLMELIGHEMLPVEGAGAYMEQWFGRVEGLFEQDKLYYITDGYLWGTETDSLPNPLTKAELEQRWNHLLADLQKRHSNVRVFPYHRIIERLGEVNSFSLKTWYLGKIPHTTDAQKCICEQIGKLVAREYGVSKKVLVLDLDNTLWGGLAGEHEHTPIELSDDHSGLAYKNQQRVIRMMQESGVLLAIVSKNNEEDAMELIRSHPHMILREEAFAAKRINWKQKHENILELAEELKLGVDSFVFWDDNPQERELVKQMLPQVAVPDFPQKPEELADAMVKLYETYFAKAVVTREDQEKTRQYQENAKRNELQQSTGSFADYLKQLQIQVRRVEAKAHAERFHQLVNKTNQFNLTTKRYEFAEIMEILENPAKEVYLYEVQDCFGDYGIVSALIVDKQGDAPEIEEFVLSCRIMGKQIEYAILEQVEDDLQRVGYEKLHGRYIPTAKNKPVESLYDKLGYAVITEQESGEKLYELNLDNRPKREYYAQMFDL